MPVTNDHDMIIEIAAILKGMSSDITEMKMQFEAYATKDYVNAKIATTCNECKNKATASQPDTVGGVLSRLAASRTGVAIMVVTIVLALLGVLNMLGQNQITQDDLRNLVKTEIVNAQTSGGK